MWASCNGHKEVVKLLLDHGADMNMQDEVSVTDMIYMRDVYVMYVYVCVYDCMINVMIFFCLQIENHSAFFILRIGEEMLRCSSL